MKVLEIKNNLVKISYDAAEHLVLSGFVIIEDDNMPYVAQIVNLKADESGNFAIAKLIFTFNSDGIVTNYDGSIPSLKALVTPLPSAELLDILPVNNPFKLGMLAQQPFMLNLDQTLLKKDLLICSDTNESTSVIVNNFIKQLQRNSQKAVVCDINDAIEHEDKFIFGEDFKLPLNYDTINFIWENDLDDIDAKSKAIIQDIFLEVQEYAKTASHEYIPFETFISVVDAQYHETNIPELILLKNKLLKYRENHVFAEHHDEFENLKVFLQKNLVTVVDLSTIFNPKLQKQVIEFVYDVMHSLHETIIAFTVINNTNSDKKLIKRFYSSGTVFTTVVCNHDYKYITELKQIARNMLLFTPQTVQHDFSSYNTFLNKLNPDEFVIYGELTQNIPLIVQLMQIETLDTLERKLEEEKRIEEEKQKEFEKAQAELALASKPINTPIIEQQSINYEEPETLPDNELSIDKEEDAEEAFEEDINDVDTEVFSDIDEINETEELEIVQEEELNPYEEIIVQDDGSEIEEEVLPPDSIDDNEELPEDPYQNIFEQQTPFVDNEINDNAAQTVDEYIIYNDKKDEIPSIDEILEREEQLQEPEFGNDEDLNPDNIEFLDDEPAQTQIISEDIEPEINPFEQPLIEEIEDIKDEPAIEYLKAEEPKYVGINDEPITDEIIPSVEDNLTEDDLNFIEEINLDSENAEEIQTAEEQNVINPAAQSFDDLEDLGLNEELGENLQEIENENEISFSDVENNQPPVVPIYPADELENIDIVEGGGETFEQGDKVSHPKYGVGIVEKMIKYGNKTLCSINFENVGRRLLDPAISEISKA